MKHKHDEPGVRHWEHRAESRWKDFHFNQPYEKGLRRLKEEVLGKTNFDPATLWQWGTMQARAVIEILETVEAKFGAEGQRAIFESLHRVGYDIGQQLTVGTEIPADMTGGEWVSFFATVINRIAYASLETPEVRDDGSAHFHIDWCPHQDHYAPFDCRVQRYFVQGMIDAATDFARSQGKELAFDVAFQTTIPAGAETCHFELFRADPGKARRWREYTELMEQRALELARRRQDSGK